MPLIPSSRPTALLSRRPWTALAVVLLLALSLVPASTAAANSPEQARIAETREELAEVRAELDSARSEADDDQIALEDADRQLEAVFAAVDAAQAAVDRQQQAVDDAEADLAAAEQVLAEQQARMADRIARLYRQAAPDPLISVLDASTVSQAVQQSAYITAIGRQDRVLVEGLSTAQARVEGQARALAEEEVALEGVLAEQQDLLAEVEEIRNDRALIAAASQDLVARLQSREEHLEEEAIALLREQAARAAAQAAAEREAAEQLADEVTADDEEEGEDDGEQIAAPIPAPAAPAPSGGGGGFQWPAGGTVTSGFGPRWGRNHNGIDIAAGSGSPIVAARGGTVTKAENWSGSGFGNVVIIAHSNGFASLYAHMSSISVSAGQSVGAGTYLGGMGCTGSCTGTHLHFEIWSGGTPVDPMGYL